jgi:peroxiredoxin/mono/diheme cytochrome c family protein
MATAFVCLMSLAETSAAGDASAVSPRPTADSMLGRRIPDFVLPDTAGQEIGLSDYANRDAIVVVFTSTACPIANAYVPVLNQLAKDYAERKVAVIGINSVPGNSAEAIAAHAKEFAVEFPVLVDERQSVLSLCGARRTSEVYLLDRRQTVRYHGRIDDRFGYDYKRAEPRRHDLREALDELLAGKPVSIAETDAAGCLITRRELQSKQGEITYADHVAPILQKNCVDCHHPGTAAPFSLLTAADAANWSEMIREVVVQRRMPPWHADPRFGHFVNERRLSQDEIDTLVAWVDAGAPVGNAAQAPVPADVTEGWRIGKPDVVFQMPREYTVKADGEVAYQYFTTPTNFTEDVWIQAAECRPGNRAVVHHIIVFYRDPERREGQRRRDNMVWISATAPGADPLVFPAGLGRKIPAGAELVWQVHYTPTGKEEVDRSEIGLVFAKEPPKHDVTTFGIQNNKFEVPPGASRYEVVSMIPILHDSVIMSLFPHMHLRGRDFKYEAIYPDGRRETLLSVPQYDFNWQHTYRFETPLRIPQGSMLRCTAHFDNSADNPANPDPSQPVRWGDQTWEEMMIGYIDFYREDSQ